MVTVTSVGSGKCIWCLESGDGVHAQFKDGLSGFLCKKHFWQALQIRADLPPAETGGTKGSAPPRPEGATSSRASSGSPFHSEGKD